jgi:hypothetical protein
VNVIATRKVELKCPNGHKLIMIVYPKTPLAEVCGVCLKQYIKESKNENL